ncbi:MULTISPECIES: TA system antitoxin ParD family protein [Moraxella]|uniref:Uncharacterized protein n=3 Tax=Moraxella TaxID=475 RepID=A0AAC8PVE6_9GAMM|nr:MULTISPECIES: hypothetical protein [Moraxella]AKG07047.1 hypothetical protein AAX06_01325 [Moraxella bovoculi]AKG12202.1 hypothetical protein AAX07_09740 [Moraxella bovoculi]AKG14172.1 hypothetical protein AAX11_09280 [Moraxella bovoculi]UYZ79126.1 hypothetical protein LP115_04655 [Moraxella bovis]UYZ87608.1 hypothetical protein LP094_04670 [Moraxella bovis]
MYTCSFDDELTAIVKRQAKIEHRSIRGQFVHYLKLALMQENLLNETADTVRQDEMPADNTQKEMLDDHFNTSHTDCQFHL